MSGHRRRRRRDLGVLAVATLAGVWLGVTAPSVSPVTPAAPPPTAGVAVVAVVTPPATS